MKTCALVLALIALTDVTAIQMSVEPVIDSKKKDEPTAAEKDAKLVAKMAENNKKADAMKEKAKEAEGKKMEADEKEADRQKAAYQTAYWSHMNTQAKEMGEIAAKRAERPEGSAVDPVTAESGLTPAEHWTSSMPEHIITNGAGATIPYVLNQKK